MPAAAPVLYLAPHRWDGIQARAQGLTRALAAHRPVVYVEPVVSLLGNVRLLLGRQPTRAWRGTLHQPADNLWVYAPPPVLPLTRDSSAANTIAHASARPALLRALARLGIERPIAVAAWPPAVAWTGRLGERAIIYDCMDDFAAFPQPRHRRVLLQRWEAALVRRAGLIVATAEPLRALWTAVHPHVAVIRNGVAADFIEAVKEAPLPGDLEPIPPPRLLYVGTISHWFDAIAVAELAASRPELSIVLLGPVEVEPMPLRGHPNVHLLGPRPHAALPGYLAAADVLLIPFRRNRLTEAVNPVKLYEYLASGVPIVATPLPELQPFAELVYLAEGAGGLRLGVADALAEGRDERRRAARRAAATANTWEQRAAEFDALLRRLERWH